MKTLQSKTVLTLLAWTASVASAYAITITDFVGDADGLGGRPGAVNGGNVLTGAFDNRSPAEMAAIDGSQFTDRSTSSFGINVDFADFVHSYSLGAIATITGVSIEFGIAGMQSNDNNTATKSGGEDGLFVDGVLVPHAFEPLIQDGDDYDVFSLSLTPGFFALFADGTAAVRIDSNSAGGTMPGGGSSPIWYDYVKLTITGDPAATVPDTGSTFPLLGAALVGLTLLRSNPRIFDHFRQFSL